ncbi:Anion-transporting ATPase [Nostocoides jenkinsii Ben 74]|uniref:Anion-transporting ATPase n=1 Tax=Nostocoides jenkinsii Ben 74 TaxID=1193518 RepID=A0A077MAM2_9MICO|nr:Anion-transporting ATPase [Tetrasphaera jenkinsii Ben 74]
MGDAFDVDLSGGTPVQIEDGLHALQVNGRAHFDGSWTVVHAYLVQTLSALGVDPLVAEEMTSLPGADEIAALLELRAQVESRMWDLVVVDCAPTAETLRMLALPENLAWHLGRIIPGTVGLRRAARPAAAAALGIPLPDIEVLSVIRDWYAEMVAVRAILGSERASVRLVTTSEAVVIAESRRTWTSLSLYGFAVDAIYVNKILPSVVAGDHGPAADWLASWNEAQRRGLAEVATSFVGIPVVQAPYLAREPVGVDALAALGSAWIDADLTPILQPVAAAAMQVERTDSGYTLALRLPLASASDVGLQRREDDLILTVGEHRRIVTLPSVLTRCTVSGASVRGGSLTVGFVPDPAQWPR